MIKKNNDIKWINESNKSFATVKLALTEARVLINPYYSKDFLIFSFVYEDTIVVVLLQILFEGFE
jgi:hypothetical protein